MASSSFIASERMHRGGTLTIRGLLLARHRAMLTVDCSSREWYLSYLSILQSLCLFVPATELIKRCPDTSVSSLSLTSTDISLSCPTCLKPVSATALSKAPASRGSSVALRACSSCKKRISICGFCHTPVRSLGTFCIGCGNFFHLLCAKAWFIDEGMKFCPTGCGHECNKEQVLRGASFPREISRGSAAQTSVTPASN